MQRNKFINGQNMNFRGIGDEHLWSVRVIPNRTLPDISYVFPEQKLV